MKWGLSILALCALLAATAPEGGAAEQGGGDAKLLKMVVLSRHGGRSSRKGVSAQAVPANSWFAPEPHGQGRQHGQRQPGNDVFGPIELHGSKIGQQLVQFPVEL